VPNCIENLRGKLDLYKYPIDNYDISISVKKDPSLTNIVNVNIQVYKKIQKRNVTLSTNISIPTYLLSNPNQFPLNLPDDTEATVKKLDLSDNTLPTTPSASQPTTTISVAPQNNTPPNNTYTTALHPTSDKI